MPKTAILIIFPVIFILLLLTGTPSPEHPKIKDPPEKAYLKPSSKSQKPMVYFGLPNHSLNSVFPFSKEIARLIVLDEKALLSDKEQKELEKMLTSRELLRASEDLLTTIPIADNSQRFDMLYFLEKALEWDENPIRAEVEQTIERIIEISNLEGLSTHQRATIAGDKIELFAILQQHAPDRAEHLLQKNRKTKLARILGHAHLLSE